jgi:ribosomal protein L20
MEILIYISGLLTTFIAVLLVAAIKINRKYNLLLDSNQHISNISSIQNGEMREQIDDMRLLMVDIQNTMEKDQYESLSGINKELKVMSELAVSNKHLFSHIYTLYGYQRVWDYIYNTAYRRPYI